MRVIGAGFGRTGTTSLKAALKRLGFGPSYTLGEVFRNPEHVRVWEAASVPAGEAVDWEGFLAGSSASRERHDARLEVGKGRWVGWLAVTTVIRKALPVRTL
jgi:hypothetical protein